MMEDKDLEEYNKNSWTLKWNKNSLTQRVKEN